MDLDKIKRIPISDIVGRYVKLRARTKNDYWGLSPFASERSPSFHCEDDKGRFYCFSTCKGGDVIDFVMEMHSCDFKEAVQILGGEIDAGDVTLNKERPKKVDPYEGYTRVTPVPDYAGEIKPGVEVQLTNPRRADDPDTKKAYPKWAPDMVFPYRDAAGRLLGYVLRLDMKDGGKITPSVMWSQRADGHEGWTYMSFGEEGRTIYGLDRIGDAAQVVWCEGEKAADAAYKLLGIPAVTANGGTNALDRTNWNPLNGKSVLIWPDADEPGDRAAAKMIELLRGTGAARIKTLGWDQDKAKGWDAADALADGWDKKQALTWAKDRAIDVTTDPASQPANDRPVQSGLDAGREEPPPPEPEDYGPPPAQYDEEEFEDMPFRALGHENGTHYFYVFESNSIYSMAAGGMTKLGLLVLAKQRWFEVNFQSGKASIDWTSAADACLRMSAKAGIFNPRKIRGRGAWLDGDQVIINTGSDLIIDGVRQPFSAQQTEFFYSAGLKVDCPEVEPLSNQDAHKLIEICERISWRNELSSKIIAGWCVIAPICGALNWRPHIWITGPSGSGKTTVVQQIVRPMLGSWAEALEGSTTEAGIRQMLGNDARPVLFDEAEAEDDRAAAKMKAVLDMARISSSGGAVIKGSAGGRSMVFTIRSAFCFSSINPSVSQYADESRITSLDLMRDGSPNALEKFKGLQLIIHDTLKDGYAQRMFARAVQYFGVIQQNIEIFADAGVRVLGNKRVADQIAPMLAGAYLCHSTKVIDADAAEAWISKYDWTGHTTVDEAADERRCLDYLLQSEIRVDTSSGVKTATPGRLIEILMTFDPSGPISKETAGDKLRSIGIRVETHEDVVYISNSSKAIKTFFKGTPWFASHRSSISNLEGAAPATTTYFTKTLTTKAVKVPLSHFISEDPDAPQRSMELDDPDNEIPL